jgi:hypothetical protein
MTQCKGYSQRNIPYLRLEGLPPKAVHNWAEKFSQGHWEVADDARPGAEVAETTITRFLLLRVSTHW